MKVFLYILKFMLVSMLKLLEEVLVHKFARLWAFEVFYVSIGVNALYMEATYIKSFRSSLCRYSWRSIIQIWSAWWSRALGQQTLSCLIGLIELVECFGLISFCVPVYSSPRKLHHLLHFLVQYLCSGSAVHIWRYTVLWHISWRCERF